MKATIRRRVLSLLLVLALALSLAPAALAEEEDQPPASKPTIVLTANGATFSGSSLGSINPGEHIAMTAALSDGATDDVLFTWTIDSDSKAVATTDYDNVPGKSRTASISGHEPGTATLTITATRDKVPVADPVTLTVTVNGIKVLKNEITILENETYTLKEDVDFKRYGTAAASTAAPKLTSLNQTFVRATGSSWTNLALDGVEAGAAQVTLAATESGAEVGGKGTFSLTVKSNQAVTLRGTASRSAPLRFSSLEAQIAAQCSSLIPGGTLVSITGLGVSTNQGILYLGYKSADDTGSGVGSALTYNTSNQARGPYIKDIVFVPNPAFTGDMAEINYTGTANNGRTFKGKIEVSIEKDNTNITLTASPESPAKLAGSAFGEVCQRQTGAPLSYVVFTLPPSNQGVLYEGYVSDTDYTARVSATEQYNQTAINNLTFVPAPGYVGLVSIGYAGYSATGVRYDGELRINVTQSLDECIIYHDNGSGSVTFSDYDFTSYCSNVTGGRLAFVSFTPPGSSQGSLYRSYRGSALVSANDRFSTAAQIGQLTFTAADGFHGTVRIPFAGEDRSGVPFTGTVEIHIQSGGSGDIAYNCAPGGSVKFSTNDFNEMSLQQTGYRLHYITFDTLPSFTDGALYHNRTSAGAMGTSVSRDARYYNSSAPYLMNLSFWASDSFRGSIELPFTGCAVSGETFSGLVVISSSSSTGGTNTISYSTMGRQSVVFSAGDFDSVSRSSTNSGLNYVRFTLPSSSQGILYFDYNPTAAPVAISSTDSLYLSGEASVSKVSFLPAYGFSGTVLIPFSGYAISGAQFQGAVQIEVRAGATDTTIRYATHGEPVNFSAYEFQNAGGSRPVSINLGAPDDPNSGKLYYQYTCPTKYSWIATAGTDYYLSSDPMVSNLTFLPKAGYTGIATIPYTATNSDGTQFRGEISITVDASASSMYFKDLAGCSEEAVTSIDFLRSRGVVNGTGDDNYSPGLAIRRGDFCLMLYRAFQFNANGAASLFTDVPDSAYYAQAVRVLRSVGVVKGTGSNRFEPDSNISRQDAAVMVQRALQAANLSAPDASASQLMVYSDGGDVALYAQGAVACLIRQEMLPTTWTRLWPASALTRADMAVLLHRAMTR